MTPEDIKRVRGPRRSVFKGGVTTGLPEVYRLARERGLLPLGMGAAAFRRVVEAMGADVAARLKRGELVALPHGMGWLQVRRATHCARVEGGEVRSSYPVDWKRTLEWWCRDEEARLARRKLYDTSRRTTLMPVYGRAPRAAWAGVDMRFRPKRRFVAEVKEYAEQNKGVGYAVRKLRWERRRDGR